ncbi:MAG: hypothetical protein AB7Q17_04945 [Phycisphaerae bacterium]
MIATTVLFCLFIAQTHTVRLWFSTTGVDENQPIAGTPPEYISPTDGTNPVIQSVDGVQRLYLWATLMTPDWTDVTGFEIDVALYADHGQLSFVDRQMYNYRSGIYRRWGGVLLGTLTPNRISRFGAASGGASGLTAFTGPLDIHYDPDTFTYLLGSIDVQSSADANGTLFLVAGSFGDRGPPFEPFWHFGWGDDPVSAVGHPVGIESDPPDVTFIPEPATLVLVVIGVAVLRSAGRGRGCQRRA